MSFVDVVSKGITDVNFIVFGEKYPVDVYSFDREGEDLGVSIFCKNVSCNMEIHPKSGIYRQVHAFCHNCKWMYLFDETFCSMTSRPVIGVLSPEEREALGLPSSYDVKFQRITAVFIDTLDGVEVNDYYVVKDIEDFNFRDFCLF